MKNYRDSDYAANKYSNSIVYRFSDKVVKVTLETYLAENPGKTEKDFEELKALSDEIYLEQDRTENAKTKKNISIYGIEETEACSTCSLDEEYLEVKDRSYALEAVRQLMDSGKLTEVQKHRFILYYFKGLSIRQIAKQEGVFFTSVAESLNAATDKLKKIFEKL